ncbi:MAG TPA: CheR family methyltransferase [Methanotrichaceae archaeon]|nr:CheR family methyltransferase [Methanotrichaceae archaeon]
MKEPLQEKPSQENLSQENIRPKGEEDEAAKRKKKGEHKGVKEGGKEGYDEKFEALLDYLKSNRGSDFKGYKRQSLMRRVLRRMQAVNIKGFAEYQDYLEVHPEEFSNLFNTILINVTSFFRDRPAWDYLSREVVPKILEDKPDDEVIRIWSAGCATGEEAYSLAMVMIEALGEEKFKAGVKIFATDIDDSALAQARMATYSLKEMESVPKELREKYFVASAESYVFRTDLRRSIIFGRHDIIQDAPISHLDLLVCRNTLMYFNSETQSKILARFHFALNDSGYLFLGRAELLLTHTNLFVPVNLKCRIFMKMPKASTRDKLLVLAQAGDYDAASQLTRHVRLREIAFDNTSSAEMVVDLNGNLIMANERARLVLSINPRDIGRPFQDLEISYRPLELRPILERAYSERKTVHIEKVERHFPDGSVQYMEVTITPLDDNGKGLMGVMITFSDATDYYRLQEELEKSRRDLEKAYDEIRSANEELETTNEELQSTNEELETMNEELQSTNEEFQSTNEELQTTNLELRRSTDELNRANSFLESVFKSLRKGVAVIDGKKNVLIWNKHAEDMWGLRADEVLGQGIFKLDIGLPIARLHDPVVRALDEGGTEKLALEAVNRRGKKTDVSVEVLPLIGPGRDVRGAILLMEDQGPKEGSDS